MEGQDHRQFTNSRVRNETLEILRGSSISMRPLQRLLRWCFMGTECINQSFPVSGLTCRISSPNSSVAHIHSLRTTSLFGTIGAKYIPWDLEALHSVDADVLLMTNFASREFLQCLRFKSPEPIV